MKKLLSVLAAASMLSAACFMTPVNAASSPYVESDTTVNFTLAQGKTYAYKMTVHGTHDNPHIATGNGAVLQTESTVHKVENGNDVYYFKVKAIGKQGQATGVYTSLPNQKPVRHSDIAIPYSAGTYEVGTDIPAGEYVMTPNEQYTKGYYFIRNYQTAIISSGVYDCASFMTRGYVTVKAGDSLELDYATMIPMKDAGRLLPSKGNVFAPSQFKVGFDIPSGTYQIATLSSLPEHKYTIRSDNQQLTFSNIVDENSFGDTATVTVSDGQYLTVDGGALIKNS